MRRLEEEAEDTEERVGEETPLNKPSWGQEGDMWLIIIIKAGVNSWTAGSFVGFFKWGWRCITKPRVLGTRLGDKRLIACHTWCGNIATRTCHLLGLLKRKYASIWVFSGIKVRFYAVKMFFLWLQKWKKKQQQHLLSVIELWSHDWRHCCGVY